MCFRFNERPTQLGVLLRGATLAISLMKIAFLGVAFAVAAGVHAFAADGNRLAYLDSDDPFYPHRGLARLTTPQWIGEEGVEAVVVLSIDDLRDPQKYEDYVRPVLERLKLIDGRAPFSIFCNTFDPEDARFQSWLAEGVSLEVHTLAHPCPLLGKMGFSDAWRTVHGGLDLLAKIPGNTPRAAGTRLRDCDGDGRCELLVSNPAGTTISRWSEEKARWEKVDWAWPEGVSLVDRRGWDNGLRFVDLNGDGADDLIFSNDEASGIWLWAKNVNPGLGWKAGWSIVARVSNPPGRIENPPHDPRVENPRHIPPIVRTGRNNGVWFKDGRMFVQNEDTAKLGNVVDLRTFKELIAFDIPPPKSPAESLAAMKVRDGFKVELVAAEPLVVDPIAFEWDARGRLWVVEMRDYPLGRDGKGSAGGVVKVLTDTDGDGRYEQATPFLEDLAFPTGVMPWRKGALISAAPDLLYAEDTDGDGRVALAARAGEVAQASSLRYCRPSWPLASSRTRSIRLCASWQNCGSTSMPSQRRPVRSATTAVVPEPRKGSTTRSPGSVAERITRSSSASGFCEGWPHFSFELPLRLGMRQRFVANFPSAR